MHPSAESDARSSEYLTLAESFGKEKKGGATDTTASHARRKEGMLVQKGNSKSVKTIDIKKAKQSLAGRCGAERNANNVAAHTNRHSHTFQ